MAANVLNSPKAVEMSVFVVRAFVKMREVLGVTQVMEKRLAANPHLGLAQPIRAICLVGK